MTGERLAWFKVAALLHTSVAELRDRIGWDEFIGWLAYLEVDNETASKQDYYLAQIAAEVRRGYVKSPKTVKVKDFMIQSAARARGERSKQTWMKAMQPLMRKKR